MKSLINITETFLESNSEFSKNAQREMCIVLLYQDTNNEKMIN